MPSTCLRYLIPLFAASLLAGVPACSKSKEVSGAKAAAVSEMPIVSDESAESLAHIATYRQLVAAEKQRRDAKIEEGLDLVATCIARNAKTRVVYKPVAGFPAVAKLEALTDCVDRSVRSHSDACACEIAACSPAELDIPTDIAAAIAKIIDDKAYDIHCN